MRLTFNDKNRKAKPNKYNDKHKNEIFYESVQTRMHTHIQPVYPYACKQANAYK